MILPKVQSLSPSYPTNYHFWKTTKMNALLVVLVGYVCKTNRRGFLQSNTGLYVCTYSYNNMYMLHILINKLSTIRLSDWLRYYSHFWSACQYRLNKETIPSSLTSKFKYEDFRKVELSKQYAQKWQSRWTMWPVARGSVTP